MSLDYSKMCRTCLTMDGVIFPLYDNKTLHENGKATNLAARLGQISSLEISQRDKLPTKVCLNCVNEINRSYLFKLKCENSDSTLRELFGQCLRSTTAPNSNQNNQLQQQPEDYENEITQENRQGQIEKSFQLQMYKEEYTVQDVELIEDESEHNGEPEGEMIISEVASIEDIAEEDPYLKPSGLQNGHWHPDEDTQSSRLESPSVLNHTNDSFTCQTCGRQFNRQSDLSNHRKTHFKKDKRFVCSTCGRGFNFKPNLLRHQKGHMISSASGGKSVTLKTNSIKSAFNSNRMKPFGCLKCGKSFNFKDNLTKHEETHVEQNKYVCPNCGKEYNSVRSLNRHKRTHRGDELRCSICKKTFSSQGSLNRHKIWHDNKDNGITFPCELCESELSSKSNLRRHMFTVHRDR